MTTRRDFLRAGLVAAGALVIPDEQFVRRFFPVGIDLLTPRRTKTLLTGRACISKMSPDGLLICSLVVKPGATIIVPDGWTVVAS